MGSICLTCFLLMMCFFFFSKSRSSQAKVLADLFTKFGFHLGLQVNAAKSRAFFCTDVPRRKREKISSISSIRSTNSLEKYLGFFMIKGRTKKEDFNFIIEKMQNRLVSWKSQLLNKAGRLTLAKSILTSILIYYM